MSTFLVTGGPRHRAGTLRSTPGPRRAGHCGLSGLSVSGEAWDTGGAEYRCDLRLPLSKDSAAESEHTMCSSNAVCYGMGGLGELDEPSPTCEFEINALGPL